MALSMLAFFNRWVNILATRLETNWRKVPRLESRLPEAANPAGMMVQPTIAVTATGTMRGLRDSHARIPGLMKPEESRKCLGENRIRR